MYYYIYVLQSESGKMFYVGYTMNIKRRLEEHNAGEVKSTKKRIPLKLVYWDGWVNQQDTTKREKYLKTAWGKRYIKNKQLSHGVKTTMTMIYTHILRNISRVKSPLD
jgi:putative endonuclease